MGSRVHKIREIALSPLGRVFAALVGLSIVSYLIYHAGLDNVLETLSRAAPLFPLILLLESGMFICSSLALRLLYGEDRHRLPIGAQVQATLIGYAIMGLVPGGRTVAESARAALLARYSTGARAGVAATQLQGIALLANAAISFIALFGVVSVVGFSLPTALIGGNLIITSTLGLGILLAGQRSGIGAWLGRRIPSIHQFGKEFDLHFSERKLIPLGALGWEVLGRLFQVAQNGVLVVAVGGKLGIVPALISEAIHLVGASLGELIPGSLGVNEFTFQLSAQALELHPADALSIALLAHLSQLTWVVVGLLVSVLWPMTDSGKQRPKPWVKTSTV